MPGIAWAAMAALAALGACEKVSHENIDRWETTEKGAGKLRDALSSAGDPELQAHAAQILVRIGEREAVVAALAEIEVSERAAIIAPLVERLARDAQLATPMAQPQPHQLAAKDALVDLRDLATPAARDAIDRHLIRWLTGGYYEGRSSTGRYSGRRIARAIGPACGDALMATARAILERPPAADGSRARLGSELAGSLAFSQHPKALNLLLDFIVEPQTDTSLPGEARRALRRAYIDPSGIELAPGAALVPLAGRLERLAGAAETPPDVAALAVELLAAMGMPRCLPAFVAVVSSDHHDPMFRLMGAQNGIRCAGVAGIEPIVEALPTGEAYPRTLLDKHLWKEIQALSDKRAVAAAARRLLESDSWVAVVTAVSLLGKLAIEGEALADAKRVEEHARSRTRLRGWYPKTARKPDPTLGQVASQVAQNLREVAQPTKSK